MARALRAWAINRRGKNSVRNLRYRPRTRLVRGTYFEQIVYHQEGKQMTVCKGWKDGCFRRLGLGRTIHIINPVDKTKLS